MSDKQLPHFATNVGVQRKVRFEYSICTMVTKIDEYLEMLSSFQNQGFTQSDCEFIFIDNMRDNVFGAFQSLNLFLQTAAGRNIIICHQDIRLLKDGRDALDRRIAELDQKDPSWGVLGNAGADQDGRLVVRISDVFGEDQNTGQEYPQRVVSLDENFLVVKRSANLAVSNDVAAFHLYGTDIVLIAERLGYSAYVVDFHLRHLGLGRMDESFYTARRALMHKMQMTGRTRIVRTTCSDLLISGSRILTSLYLHPKGRRGIRMLFTLRRWAAVLLGVEKRGA